MRGSGLVITGFALIMLVVGIGAYVYRADRSHPTTAGSGARKPVKTPPAPLKPISPTSPIRPTKPSPIRFSDATQSMGLDFVAFSGTTPEKHFPTANGSGVALVDVDQDGWLDLYLLNCSRFDGTPPEPPNALWRNRMGLSYEEVSDRSGSDWSGFTQGVTAGDFNNDGFPDLYLVRFGPDILLVNNGDGTFQDGSPLANLDDDRWGTSAAFLDYDEDGNLDLYVANYGQWDLKWHKEHWCGQDKPPVRIYCSPKILTPEVHRLYHSLGDGRFEDVAESLGIARPDVSDRPGGRGQGVVTADVNGDGHIDIYVANDLNPNFLFINTGQGSFQDHTESSCAAYDSEGQAQAGMGVDACDVDGDGLPELFVTNFYLEHNTLYQNLGKNLFNDVSHWSGVSAGSIHAVGWGTGFEDFDEDGWPDIFVTNGHVDDNLSQIGRDEAYAQPPGIWRNAGKGRFEKMQKGLCSYFDTPHVGRGVAFGDIDNDGAMDIVVAHKDQPATILRNVSREIAENSQNNWIQLQLIGTHGNRDVVGASIECHAGSMRLYRQIKGGRSYLSAHDLRLSIGLGNAERVDRLIIRWSNGAVQELTDLTAQQLHVIREPQ